MPLPDLDLDLYSDEVILDPYPVYRRIRDLGPVVRLARHDAVAIGRFDEVRSALLADDRLVSGRGVAMNDLVNADPARVTLTTDGDLHRRLRSVLMRPMTAAAVRGIEGSIQRLADTHGHGIDNLSRVRQILEFAAECAARTPIITEPVAIAA